MTDLIAALILVAILAAASAYIIKAKRAGVKCIGCPVEGCSSKGKASAGGCGCGCGEFDIKIDSADLKKL